MQELDLPGDPEDGRSWGFGYPQHSTSDPVGSTLTVLYDPANPSTLAWPGSGSAGRRAGTVIGALLLTLLAAPAVWSRQPGARQRGQGRTPAPSASPSPSQ